MESLQSQKVAREKEICPKPSLWCPSMILSFSMAALFFFFLQPGTSMRTHPFTGLILAFNYLPEPSKLCEFEGKISRVLWISVENGPRTLILGEGARTIATTL